MVPHLCTQVRTQVVKDAISKLLEGVISCSGDDLPVDVPLQLHVGEKPQGISEVRCN